MEDDPYDQVHKGLEDDNDTQPIRESVLGGPDANIDDELNETKFQPQNNQGGSVKNNNKIILGAKYVSALQKFDSINN
jgi:hypothetical protein